MPSEHDSIEYNERERRLLDLLPRESEPRAGSEDRLVDALRGEGFFQPRRRVARAVLQVAAAIALLLVGGWGGGRLAARDSIEASLLREDLSVTDRVLLLQRAGSIYVRAANAYADATAKTDSTAIEVARQVLIGAAQAVARSDLDGGLSPELTAVLHKAAQSQGNTPRQPIFWF